MPDSGVTKTIDKVGELLKQVAELSTSDVLVGIPKERNARRDGKIGNAELARVHEFGSPARNIPARPFLYPGLRKVRPEVIKLLHEGAMKAVRFEHVNVDATLHKVGLIARNAVVEAITDPAPPFTPLKPATIRARLRRTAAGRRKLRQIKAGGQQLGMNMSEILTGYAEASWDTGGAGLNIQPLLDTLQMRAAITYVVRKVE